LKKKKIERGGNRVGRENDAEKGKVCLMISNPRLSVDESITLRGTVCWGKSRKKHGKKKKIKEHCLPGVNNDPGWPSSL